MNTEPAKKTSRILLVDDEDDLRAFLRVVLSKAGFDVCEARNGVDGMHRLIHEPFDLVVTDIAMPLKDGLAMIKDAWVLAPEVRFVVYSGSDDQDPEQVNRFSARNVLSVLSKPMAAPAFVSAIQGALQHDSDRTCSGQVSHTAANQGLHSNNEASHDSRRA
jgi:two-component system, cell cycle response regulator CpdR